MRLMIKTAVTTNAVQMIIDVLLNTSINTSTNLFCALRIS